MPGVIPTDLFKNALLYLGAVGAVDSVQPEQNEVCRRTYNRMAGQFNKRLRNAPYIQTQTFTFPRTDRFYTIGKSTNSPAPDFALTGQDRPVKLEEYAQLVLTQSTPNVFIQLAVQNVDQYSLNPIPQLTATLPLTLWYQATFPNGTITLWPEPVTQSNKLSIWWRWQLPQLGDFSTTDPTTSFDAPEGMEEALTLTLAEKLWLQFPKRTDLEELKRQAHMARADWQTANAKAPKIGLTDGVLDSPRKGGFNWLTRLPG